MKIIGITGGIGMGKSAVAESLGQQGCRVIDTDQIARDVVKRDGPCFERITLRFGEVVLDPEGNLDRGALARLVFADGQARKDLELILHPEIRSVWLNTVASWKREGSVIGFVIIPLLFETHAELYFSTVVCVACSAETQLNRLKQRGWSETEIQQRIDAQMRIEEKIARSNFLIWTEGSLEVMEEQLNIILDQLTR